MSALLLSALLAAAAPAQAGGELQIPVRLEQSSSEAQPAWPVVLGLPLPPGALADTAPLQIDAGGAFLPADGQVLSRWEDGSVRWLRVEFVAPPLAAGQHWSGVLGLRAEAGAPAGRLELETLPGQPLAADTGGLRLAGADGPGELFALTRGGAALLDGAARFELETAAGLLLPLAPAGLELERLGELSLTLRRIDELADGGGETVARLTTRITLHRGSELVRLQQSLDVLRGVHAMRGWRLLLPVAGAGPRCSAPLDSRRIATPRGDTEVLQAAPGGFDFQGKAKSGDFPGVVALGDLSAGLRLFGELAPTRMARRGDTLIVDFCPGSAERAEILEEGFGRTVELWLRGGRPRAADLRALAALLRRPLLPHATAEWYVAAQAFGELGLALAGDHADLEEKLAQSTDQMLAARTLDPAHHFGLQHFGDFHDGEHSLAYEGVLQQEYDPGLVLLQQFLRTGDRDYLEPALELAWHYADVDMTPYGGAFQHRAGVRHVDTWIAGILADDLELECAAWPQDDGSLATALAWCRQQWGAEAEATLVEWIGIDRGRGVSEQQLRGRLFEMVGFEMVERLREQLPESSSPALRDYAAALAQAPLARDHGYDDADQDFAGFFALYGGSWQDFPSFHVDRSPVPERRHESGHSLVQSVALAHLLSGEPRLRERALALGQHHVDELLPRAIATLEADRDGGVVELFTRTVAWPLINLDTLVDLSCGMPEEQVLHDAMRAALDDAANCLKSMPNERLRSSIHAGLTLEALVRYHLRSGDAASAAHLGALARAWARDQYDWTEHAFRYHAEGPSEASAGMSGLMVYGLAYAQTLQHDDEQWRVLQDAWSHLPQRSRYAKAYAMLYRGAARTLALMRKLQAVQP